MRTCPSRPARGRWVDYGFGPVFEPLPDAADADEPPETQPAAAAAPPLDAAGGRTSLPAAPASERITAAVARSVRGWAVHPEQRLWQQADLQPDAADGTARVRFLRDGAEWTVPARLTQRDEDVARQPWAPGAQCLWRHAADGAWSIGHIDCVWPPDDGGTHGGGAPMVQVHSYRLPHAGGGRGVATDTEAVPWDAVRPLPPLSDPATLGHLQAGAAVLVPVDVGRWALACVLQRFPDDVLVQAPHWHTPRLAKLGNVLPLPPPLAWTPAPAAPAAPSAAPPTTADAWLVPGAPCRLVGRDVGTLRRTATVVSVHLGGQLVGVRPDDAPATTVEYVMPNDLRPLSPPASAATEAGADGEGHTPLPRPPRPPPPRPPPAAASAAAAVEAPRVAPVVPRALPTYESFRMHDEKDLQWDCLLTVRWCSPGRCGGSGG